MMKFSFSAVLFLFIGYISAQEIILPPDNIKSIQLSSSKNGVFEAIIPMNGSIHLSFDDLDADEKDYYYKIEHCNRFWETSDLVTTEFIRGYAEEQIQDYENSFNTLQFYTHYHLQIPNENTKLLISGNYRISILDEDDNVVFTRYFIIYESTVTVGVSVHRSRDITYINEQQSVQFIIDHHNFRITNPRDEVYPVLLQNNDFSTQITGLKPQFIRGEQLLYKYDEETAFWGGNEFLNFDNKEIKGGDLNIVNVVSGDDLYHTYLYTDKERFADSYTYYPDANGVFVIRNIHADDPAIEADYTWVHFSLDVYEPYDGKQVYVYGAFNNFQLTEENKLSYNPTTSRYEGAILLKQGFYNYTYVTLDKADTISTIDINGSFDETENEYTVLVYYTEFGSNYDRVIGYGKGNSLHLQQ